MRGQTVGAHADLAARDRAVPGLRILFEPAHLAQALESASGARVTDLRPVYVRYKAGTSCLVGYRVAGTMGASFVYAKAFRLSNLEKFEKAAASGCAETWLGACPVVLPDDGAIVWAFPNDARLRLLCRAFEPGGRDRLLQRAPERLHAVSATGFRTLAYRPERRFVAAAHAPQGEEPCAVMKMYTRAGYQHAAVRTRVAASREVLRVPRRLAKDSRRHLLFFEWLPGRLATEQVHSREPLGSALLIGRALAELHAQPVGASTPPSSSYDRAGVCAVLEDVAVVFPQLAGRLERLRDLVDDALAGRFVPALVHGDLHLRQVLVSGGSIGFVDFDRAGAGPAAGDVGCCLAHLERDVLTGDLDAQRAGEVADQLLAGYAGLEARPASRLLRAFTAAALARLLPEPFRQCRADASDLTARMLDRALALAARAESTVVVP